MTTKYELPNDRVLAGKVLDAEHKIAEMGTVGSFFGSRENAALYLAFLVIFAALVIAAAFAAYEPTLRADALRAILGIAATALGYAFGVGTGRQK